MSGRLLRVGLASLVLLGSVLAAETPSTVPSPPLSATDPVTGERVTLDPAQGPMHVVFIATWCQPCLQDLPKLFELDDRWKADGYRLFLVAVPTRQTAARLKEFAASQPHAGRLLFDADGSVTSAFGATNIPAHVLVDRRGTIVARAGTVDAAFKSAVERVIRQEGRARPS